LCVLAWHYHDDDLPAPDAVVKLRLTGLPFPNGEAKVTHYRIDADHSNSYQTWLRMGSPPSPTEKQYAQLEKAGQLAELKSPGSVTIKDKAIDLQFSLPRQGVSLLVIDGN